MGKKKKSKPPQAQPIDYAALMRAAAEAAKAQFRDQLQAQIEAYPKQETLQLGTIQKISQNLRNPYTKTADRALQEAAGEISKVSLSGDRIGVSAGRADQLARDAQKFAAGPTTLDRRISWTNAPTTCEAKKLPRLPECGPPALGRSKMSEPLRAAHPQPREPKSEMSKMSEPPQAAHLLCKR